MHGVLSQEGVDPAALLRQGREEVAGYAVVIRAGLVTEVQDAESGLTLTTDDSERVFARALVVASGLTDDLPDIPGLAEQWGTGVLHCPYCHGWEVRDQRLAVLGTSPMSLHHAELIRQWSDRLTFFSAGCGPLGPHVAVRLRARGVELVDTPSPRTRPDRPGSTKRTVAGRPAHRGPHFLFRPSLKILGTVRSHFS